uniref:Kinesin-like protein n=1 Tax=Macrostomum lignano TaxID=282301 RepID=A0A1I8HZE9_9PLAT
MSAADRFTLGSACQSSHSRSASCSAGGASGASPTSPAAATTDETATGPWITARERLARLLSALTAALANMARDRRRLLAASTEATDEPPGASERLQRGPQAYLAPAECAALRAFECTDQLSDFHRRLRLCPPALRAELRQLEARLRATLEEAAQLQQGVAGSGAAGDQSSTNLPRLSDLGTGDCRERAASQDFVGELVNRVQQAERENRCLRARQAKLKRVLRDAKEQRRQLKELARRLKTERDQAMLQVCHLSEQLHAATTAAATAAVEAASIAKEDDRSDLDEEESRTTRSMSMTMLPSHRQPSPHQQRCRLSTPSSVASWGMDGAAGGRAIPDDRRGKLRIFVRIRPDDSAGLLKVAGRCKILLRTRGVPGANASLNSFDSRAFYYDRVFGPESSSACVFGAMTELVGSCCSGHNVCIMAYGQTGSGKTHTMVGDQLNPGVNRLAIASVLRACRGRSGWQFSFAMCAVEVYNEDIRDLLRPPRAANAGGTAPKGLKLMTDVSGAAAIQGLTEIPVTSEADIDRCIARCERTRIYSATRLNGVSSRSHVIVMLRVSGESGAASELTSQSVTSTLTLCDLAGSESVQKSGVCGAGLREASAINRSLLSLGKVFEDLRKRQRPCFRESKLTRLLQPHLTGSSRCLVIVTVRESVNHLDETIRSLMFGHSAMQTQPADCAAAAAAAVDADAATAASATTAGTSIRHD